MRAAQRKYNYDIGWAKPDWEKSCRRQLLEHLEKGDPRDVALYAAFMWWHGWTTNEPIQVQASAPTAEDIAWAERVFGADQDAA
jgi:hypothetical protein